jgi:hypothetical protein
MKGKIDKDGFLWIERKGEWTKQRCPFVGDDWCGHWCPLFGEPRGERCAGEEIKLDICKKTLFFSELTDER